MIQHAQKLQPSVQAWLSKAANGACEIPTSVRLLYGTCVQCIKSGRPGGNPNNQAIDGKKEVVVIRLQWQQIAELWPSNFCASERVGEMSSSWARNFQTPSEVH